MDSTTLRSVMSFEKALISNQSNLTHEHTQKKTQIRAGNGDAMQANTSANSVPRHSCASQELGAHDAKPRISGWPTNHRTEGGGRGTGRRRRRYMRCSSPRQAPPLSSPCRRAQRRGWTGRRPLLSFSSGGSASANGELSEEEHPVYKVGRGGSFFPHVPFFSPTSPRHRWFLKCVARYRNFERLTTN